MAKVFSSADFFAGSGLVTMGLKPYFESIWANDISASKERIFRLNHPSSHFIRKDICDVNGKDLPTVDLAWASFPCQDLSLAGNLGGIDGARSGLVWEWIRVLSEMKNLPVVVVAENVYGLLTSNSGQDYLRLHHALADLGYEVGAVVLDALDFLPQSRVRVFVVGVRTNYHKTEMELSSPDWCHPKPVMDLANLIPGFKFWALPKPVKKAHSLKDIIDRGVFVEQARSKLLKALIPNPQLERIKELFLADNESVFAAYRRTRGSGQRLEVRVDQQSGCLRTAKGGSSKQILVYLEKGEMICRYMTAREAARTMGAPEEFLLVGSHNEAYSAMGDAVALPVTQFLVQNLIFDLANPKHEKHRRPIIA